MPTFPQDKGERVPGSRIVSCKRERTRLIQIQVL